MGEQKCQECPLGRVTTAPGQSVCDMCGLGSYADAKGKSACTPCTNGQTTATPATSESRLCVCAEGSYLPKARDSVCQPCPPGMNCVIGSDMANFPYCPENESATQDCTPNNRSVPEFQDRFPKLKPKHASMVAEDPLSVYKCANTKACPGGAPGTCGEHYYGIACGNCDEGYYKSGQMCNKCNWLETSKLLFPILPVTLAPVLINLYYWRMQDTVQRWGSPRNGLAIAAFIIVFHCQSVAIIGAFDLVFPSLVDDVWKGSDFFLDCLSVLRPQCAGIQDFQTNFIMNMTTPIVAFLLFLLTWGLFKGVGVMSQRTTRSPFSKNRMVAIFQCAATPMDGNIVFNCYCAVMYTFSITIASIAMTLFKCYTHPNNKKSMKAHPQIICGSDEWTSMVALAVVGILIYCVAAQAVTTVVLYVAPKNFHDPVFRQRWKFLLAKFRPEVWWWGQMIILKGILLNFAITIFESAWIRSLGAWWCFSCTPSAW